jgi:hypothetical protein
MGDDPCATALQAVYQRRGKVFLKTSKAAASDCVSGDD